MQYFLQVTLYSGLFYTVYLLFLKNRAAHRWNRFYLLFCVSLPLVLPLIRVPALYRAMPINSNAFSYVLPRFTVPDHSTAEVARQGSINVILIAYLFIAGVVLAWNLLMYFGFRKFVSKARRRILNNEIVLVDTRQGPGSFQNYIFFPGDDIDPRIFDHELAHVRLRHSSDIMFIRVLQSFFWPHVMSFLILKELKIVHEFQADAYAAKNEDDYIKTLLNEAFGTQRFVLAHTFFYHPLKRRILMLQNKKGSRARLRRATITAGSLAAIVFASAVYMQSCRPGYKIETPTATKTMQINADAPDTQARPGYDLQQFLADNLKYPEGARLQNTSGRVMVKFAIDESGNIINPEIIKSPDTLLSLEALRVMKLLPPWRPAIKNNLPVKTNFFLPLLFALGDADSKSSEKNENGLTKDENDTLSSLIYKGGANKNQLTYEEGKTLLRLMQKRSKNELYLDKDSLNKH